MKNQSYVYYSVISSGHGVICFIFGQGVCFIFGHFLRIPPVQLGVCVFASSIILIVARTEPPPMKTISAVVYPIFRNCCFLGCENTRCMMDKNPDKEIPSATILRRTPYCCNKNAQNKIRISPPNAARDAMYKFDAKSFLFKIIHLLL